MRIEFRKFSCGLRHFRRPSLSAQRPVCVSHVTPATSLSYFVNIVYLDELNRRGRENKKHVPAPSEDGTVKTEYTRVCRVLGSTS